MMHLCIYDRIFKRNIISVVIQRFFVYTCKKGRYPYGQFLESGK